MFGNEYTLSDLHTECVLLANIFLERIAYLSIGNLPYIVAEGRTLLVAILLENY